MTATKIGTIMHPRVVILFNESSVLVLHSGWFDNKIGVAVCSILYCGVVTASVLTE